MSRRYSRGTTYTTSTALDWRELLEDPEVERIVRMAWFKAKRTIYSSPMYALALDDLESWLWERAADAAQRFARLPDVDRSRVRDHWLRHLWSWLVEYGLRKHREEFCGPTPSEARRGRGTKFKAITGAVSIDENLELREQGAGVVDLFGNRRLRHNDPLFEVLLLERLQEKVAAGEPLEVKVDGICVEIGCDQAEKARRLCGYHYDRAYRSGREMPDARPRRLRGRSVCSIDGCDHFVQGRGLCQMHYARMRRHGDPLKRSA